MTVVILCGGKGTRSYPFTEYFPKPMMPIGGTPILVHLMRIYAQQGFNQFVLSAGHRKEILEDYFDGRFREWSIRVVDTGSDADTGERIRRCAEFVSDTFFATYGDGLGDIDLGRLLAFHMASGGAATVTSVPLRSQYGTVVSDASGKVAQFVEKPVIREHWINAGFFVMSTRIFDFLGPGEELVQEPFQRLIDISALTTYRHEGFFVPMDTFKDRQVLEDLYAQGSPPWELWRSRPV